MSAPLNTIGVAVVEHHGRYLVGTRREGSPLAGYAEFPGGKCLPQESPGRCACRECLEETGLEVRTIDLLMHRTFTYDHGSVDLHFWLCHPTDPEKVDESHHGFGWVTADELKLLKFPEANAPLIELLTGSSHPAATQHGGHQPGANPRGGSDSGSGNKATRS